MKILSISDKIVSFIYSPQVKLKYGHVDFVIACGDLPYYYQEYIVSTLDVPLFYVRGNHDPVKEYSETGAYTGPQGGTDLHRSVIHFKGVLFAGVEGCIRYNQRAVFMYSQRQMWQHVFGLIPRLWLNRLRYGRYLDVFVTHAPPKGIHDKSDLPHQGVNAFRWFIRVFKPKYHFHGHTHIYRPDEPRQTHFHETQVINAYQYFETDLDLR